MRFPESAWKDFAAHKIHDAKELASLLAEKRGSGKRVALLNGSFDLLHAGHLYILFEASKVADILVVALNSDASVKRYKGKERPIIGLQDRMELVSALAFVDYVTWFEEDDPRELIRIIRPDFHVNGREYGPHCVEADTVRECGGALHLVDRIPSLATSTIIKTIQNVCDESSPQKIRMN